MEKIETYIELNRMEVLQRGQIFRTPVWQILLFGQYKKNLPFMAGNDFDLSSSAIYIGEVNINNEALQKMPRLFGYTDEDGVYHEGCFDVQKSFYQGGQVFNSIEDQTIKNVLYLHLNDHDPQWLVTNGTMPVILGFSSGKLRVFGDAVYYTGLDYKTTIKKTADNLEYGKMKFNSTTIEIINRDGQFDNAIDFIGNNASIKYALSPYTRTEPAVQYYISNAVIKTGMISFECKDKRERLAQKIPNDFFTLEEFPKINKDYVGKIKQEVYGYYRGVSGVCIDELDIYNPDGSEKGNRRFRFSSQIAGDITLLEIKQTQDTSGQSQGEKWTAIPPDGWAYERENGILAIKNIYCLSLLPNGKPKLDAKPYEVRASGYFNSAKKPREIIEHILFKYAQIAYAESNYNIAEWEAELDGLADIGVVFDKATDIFQAIAKVQTLSVLGFQVYYDFDKFSARLDDNKRAPQLSINSLDILNINDIEIDMNTDLYATSVQVKWGLNFQAKSAEILTDNRNEERLLTLFKIPKTYEIETGLQTLTQAQERANYLADFFSQIRPTIKGIKLFGSQFFKLKLYDTLTIDLTLKDRQTDLILKRIATAIAFANSTADQTFIYKHKTEHAQSSQQITNDLTNTTNVRKFGGVFVGKVMEINIDINSAITEISVLFLRSI
jgi:hypothetical protein